MLDYLKERNVKVRSGLDEAAVRELYSAAWQADPAHHAVMTRLLADQARTDRIRQLRTDILTNYGVKADESLDEAGLKALHQRLDGESRDRLAEQARQAAAQGEVLLQRVTFTDGGSMVGHYDALTGRMEVYEAETGQRAGEISVNHNTVASVEKISVPLRERAVQPVAPAEDPAVPAGGAATESGGSVTAQVEPVRRSNRPGSNGSWITDPAEALRSATADRRPILMLFTGSDWCPWCVKLDDEILRTAAFKDWASSHVVLLYLDFPRKRQLSADQRRINQELSQKYAVRGYPTVLFTDSAGVVRGTTSYAEGGPANWIAACNSIIGASR